LRFPRNGSHNADGDFAAHGVPGSPLRRAADVQQIGEVRRMATVKIDVVTQNELPVIVGLYNRVYRPQRDVAFFKRRFLGRYNPLMLVASLDEAPIGFFLGFELKPNVFFFWLFGVIPEFHRQGIASQMMEAAQDWAYQHGYTSIRFECQNQHRPMLHLAIANEYDIVGIRWDPDRGQNLVIFEKQLTLEE
jgi:GNAT superfamily N-acetyltransferase